VLFTDEKMLGDPAAYLSVGAALPAFTSIRPFKRFGLQSAQLADHLLPVCLGAGGARLPS
jgi:hypothetical protein